MCLYWMKSMVFAGCVLAGWGVSLGLGNEPAGLAESLVFHAPFDGSAHARVATANPQIHTADSTAREKIQAGLQGSIAELATGAGRFGDALHFPRRVDQVLFYDGENVPYSRQDWSGSVSFWLKLDPDKDLEPGFCDPIQITDKTWNDAAMFVDFDKELPRDFRLGVFSNFDHWNPEDIAWNDVPAEQRPLVTVEKPPFQADAWTHVLFTFERINAASAKAPAAGEQRPQLPDSTATLYLNGRSYGTIERPLQLDWELEKVAMMIGINYIGYLDDLALFDRALTADEVVTLYQLPGGIGGIVKE